MKKIIFIIAVAPVIANAGLFGPSNFEECILKGMKNVSSDQAANMIAYACREKFPAPKSTTPDAPLYESPKSFYFRSTDDLGSTVTQLIVKIETNHMRVRTHGTDYGSGIRSHDFGYHLEIEARNRNDFRIGGIWVGVPKKRAFARGRRKATARFITVAESLRPVRRALSAAISPESKKDNSTLAPSVLISTAPTAN